MILTSDLEMIVLTASRYLREDGFSHVVQPEEMYYVITTTYIAGGQQYAASTSFYPLETHYQNLRDKMATIDYICQVLEEQIAKIKAERVKVLLGES